MHFKDLTPYTYGGTEPSASVLNVGWLGARHSFRKARPTSELVSVLNKLVASPVNLYRGKHQCEFCRARRPGPEEILGNGEIRVVGVDGVTYVAPVLIRHYVETHQYAPPEAFVQACLAAVNRIDG
jgi:hypothetical protein